MEDLEKKHLTLESENHSLVQERFQLEKDIRRLRGDLDAKKRSCDELVNENHSLRQASSAANNADVHQRLSETQQQVRDLLGELDAERNAASALREEMVQEKIQLQQLSNDLDRVNAEIDRVRFVPGEASSNAPAPRRK